MLSKGVHAGLLRPQALKSPQAGRRTRGQLLGRFQQCRVKAVAERQDEPQNWAAASYIPLVVSNAALAAVTALAPHQCSDFLFGHPIGDDLHHSAIVPLMRLLSAGFATAAFVSFALKQALEDRPVSREKFVRLNLGLSAFATINILLLSTSLVSPDGVLEYPARPAFWAAAAVFAFTLFVSWGKYAKEPELSALKNSVPRIKTLRKDVKEFADQRSLDQYFPNSYTVITLSLAAFGLSQLFVPWKLLDLLLINEGGDENQLMARLYSSSLVTLLPAVSYSLKEVARDVKIKESPSKCLNYGLATTAVLNIVVFLPYLTHGQGGLLLAPYLLLWLATLTTSVNYASNNPKQL